MRTFKAIFTGAALGIIFVLFFTIGALADTPVDPGTFLAQVIEFVRGFGGLNSFAKLSAFLVLLVASMKVSFLNDLFWSKLGAFKTWLAPILSLAVGVVQMVSAGNFSLAGLMAYLAAGAGAVALHELLDTVKSIPGIGSWWVAIINVIENALGGPAAKQTLPVR